MQSLQLSSSVQRTFGDMLWVHQRTEAIKTLFPAEWTKLSKQDLLEIAEGLRAIGFHFVEYIEVADAFDALQRLGIFMREGCWFKVNDGWDVTKISHFNFIEESMHVH